jgi:glycosyltransferase involved in cell wall biosynthesis
MIFSVIVPFHNEEMFIERCLRSLIDQDFEKNEYELIFVDNRSTDESGRIVKGHPGVRLFSETSPGAYAARNKGIRAARGEILAFTDGDCEAAKDWLARIHSGIKSLRAGVVLGSRSFASRKSKPLLLLADYENAKIKFVLGAPSSKEYGYGYNNNMAVQREIFERLGPFSEMARGGDTGFIQKYLRSTPDAKLAYLPGMLIHHLELERFKDWLGKQVIRGESNKRLGWRGEHKDLTAAMRWRIFRRTIQENGYGLGRSFLLLFLLGLGNICYAAGEVKARLSE